MEPGRVVYGIEPTAAAKYARGRLDYVCQGLFPSDLPDGWTDFDVICFNDVLEHLADPWSALETAVKLLAPAGRIVASLPNVRFIDVTIDLTLRGQWHYQTTGVLDRSHLRFFTRASIVDMLDEAGLGIDRIVATHLNQSNRLVARVIRHLGLTRLLEDLLAQRYVVVASKA
jgi:2-polyprenyl-3-methyl-5-hydroxy-6-metoxy-1,4-benzoquinol methylase